MDRLSVHHHWLLHGETWLNNLNVYPEGRRPGVIDRLDHHGLHHVTRLSNANTNGGSANVVVWLHHHRLNHALCKLNLSWLGNHRLHYLTLRDCHVLHSRLHHGLGVHGCHWGELNWRDALCNHRRGASLRGELLHGVTKPKPESTVWLRPDSVFRSTTKEATPGCRTKL